MTPAEKQKMYQTSLAFLAEANRLLVSGRAGDDVARKTHELFEDIPAALRERWAVDGAFKALKRVEKTGGQLGALVASIYERAHNDPEFQRRMADFWGCIADAGELKDEDDLDITPGEVDDENEQDNSRSGGTFEAAPPAGAPRSEFEYPRESGGDPTPEGDEAATEGDADDGGDVDTSVDGTGGE